MGRRFKFVVTFKTNRRGHAQQTKDFVATARTPEQAAARIRNGYVISVRKYPG